MTDDRSPTGPDDAAERSLNPGPIDPDALADLVTDAPTGLDLVLSGGREQPASLDGHADLVSHVCKETHPIDASQGTRQGTEY